MRHPFVPWLFAVGGLLGAASAGAASDSGVDLGLRFGYGIPLGGGAASAANPSDVIPLSDLVTAQLPIWIDTGYRFTPNIMAGAYFQYGPAFTKDCPETASCVARDIRLGAQFQYRVQPERPLDPWFGVGAGYEWLSLAESAGGQDAHASMNGFELGNVQGGLDFAVADGFGIGPFVSFSLGQFQSATAELPGFSRSGDIPNKAIHEWLVLGVRGVYDP